MSNSQPNINKRFIQSFETVQEEIKDEDIINHFSIIENFDQLKALAGVGSKTAKVILNCAFGYPTIAVDTHVFRVSNRIHLVATKTPEKTEDALLKAIPEKWHMHAHHWLILLGRYVCKARKPECYACPISHLCEYEDKTKK